MGDRIWRYGYDAMSIIHSTTMSEASCSTAGTPNKSIRVRLGNIMKDFLFGSSRSMRATNQNRKFLQVSPAMSRVWLARMEFANPVIGMDSDPCVHSKCRCITNKLVAHSSGLWSRSNMNTMTRLQAVTIPLSPLSRCHTQAA